MFGKILISFLLLTTAPTSGAPPSSWDLSGFRLILEQVEQDLHAQQVELRLLHEKIEASGSEEIVKAPLEKRIVSLEKNQEKFVGDIKKLKEYVNRLVDMEQRLAAVETQFHTELGSLKSSIASVLKVLKTEDSHFYVVQPGDSLGEIALRNKTSIRSLREANKLNTDQIIIGQKLIIPQ